MQTGIQGHAPPSRRARWRAAFGALVVAVTASGTVRADVVDDWDLAAASAGGGQYHLVLMHVAMHDALNAITHGRRAILATATAPAGPVSDVAAMNEAAFRVLAGLAAKAGAPAAGPLAERYAATRAALPDDAARAAGEALGATIAQRVLDARRDDGWPYVPVAGACPAGLSPCPPPADPVDGSTAGAYRRTPPTTRPLVTPWLGSVRPFVLDRASRFRPDGPPALTSDEYAADFAEVKRFGGAVSERTPEQTATGIFHTVPPFRFWSSVVRNAAADHGLALGENAALHAITWVAVFDATVACWDAKYHFYAWRPYTAIANPIYDDGNAETVGDPTWVPLVPSPPHPEYPSAHACVAGAISVALEDYFGTKDVALRGDGTTVGNAPGPTIQRSYASPKELIREIVDARVYGGMHFRTSNRDGVSLGKRVARYVLREGFDDDGHRGRGRDRDARRDDDDRLGGDRDRHRGDRD